MPRRAMLRSLLIGMPLLPAGVAATSARNRKLVRVALGAAALSFRIDIGGLL